MKPLILVGGGDHCKAVIEVAEEAGYNILGILDTPDKVGTKILAYSVIGCDSDISKYVNKAQFVITVGQIKSSDLRRKICKKIEDAKGSFATIIAPSAVVSKYAIIGEGTVIMHNSVIDTGVILGKHVIINITTVVGHEAIIGDFTHVSTQSIVNGGSKIGNDVFIGSLSNVNNRVTVLDHCIIGACTYINKSTQIRGTYVGIPAKLIEEQNK